MIWKLTFGLCFVFVLTRGASLKAEESTLDIVNNNIVPTINENTTENEYAVEIPFTVGGKTYFYGQNLRNQRWSIQEILPNGKVNKTDVCAWINTYSIAFSYTVAGRTYFFSQDWKTKLLFIQELLPGGKMGVETARGYFKHPYGVEFPFYVDGRTYFYAQVLDGRYWFTQELLPGGQLAVDRTDDGTSQTTYAVAFPFTVNGKTFFYAHSLKDNVEAGKHPGNFAE